MHLKMLLSMVAAASFAAAPALAQEPTGTLKKIKDTGTVTLGHRESSVPFSYYDDKQQVVGYAMDLCGRIVERLKSELKLAKLDVKLNPVTSATRIPLMANGTIDLECGWTTNNLERWLGKAKEHPGSWWPDWLEWIRTQDATEVPAREPGGGHLRPREDAPGTYVRVRD